MFAAQAGTALVAGGQKVPRIHASMDFAGPTPYLCLTISAWLSHDDARTGDSFHMNSPRLHLAVAAALVVGLLGAGVIATSAVAQDSGVITLPAPPKEPEPDDGSITVPGVLDRPVTPPDGDFRTPDQRRRDARAYDRCINRAAARQSDNAFGNPVGADPEEYCRARMGMASRDSIPDSRLKRQ
jgi:hypothetical protein